MDFEIREATIENVRDVHLYMSRIFELQLNGLSIRPNGITVEETKKYLPESLDSREKLCAVAVSDELIVGQLTFSAYPKPEYTHGGMFGMSVDPEFWRQGVGTQLLGFLDSWAAAAGFEKLDLEVWANNRPAIGLYEKSGYAHEGCRRNAIKTKGEVIDLMLMGKIL